MGVEPARVREHPGAAVPEHDALLAEPGVGCIECHPERRHPQDGDPLRPNDVDEATQPVSTGAEFLVGQFIGSGRGAGDDVRDAKAPGEQLPLFGGWRSRSVKPAPWRARQNRLPGRAKCQPVAPE